MKNLFNIAPNSSLSLVFFAFLLPIFVCSGIDKGEKLQDLKERSERILASLNRLDAKLNGLRQGEDAPVPQGSVGDSLDEEVIWENEDSVPLPDDPADSWLPKSEEAETPSTETIEWDTQVDDENEQAQEEEIFRKDDDFEFVIEKFDEDESSDSEADSFDGASNDYRFSSNDYYVIFNYGIQLGSEVEFVTNDFTNYNGDLDVSFGNNLSVEFGKSFESFELGLLVGFNNAEIDSLSGVSDGRGSGEISNYYFAIRPNYIYDFSDAMALRAGTSLGFSSRHNHFDSDAIKSVLLVGNYTFQEEKLCFLWDFHTTLQWALWENGGILFGYRFAYVTGTGDFGGQVANSFEFGGRWGF